jgi:hypothetical protein
MITTVPRASENYEIGCSTCQVGQGLAWALTTRSSAATPSTAIAEPSASSPDWPLEEEGFEPSVPEERKSASELPGGGEHSLERSPDSLLEREGCELSVTRDGQLSCFRGVTRYLARYDAGSGADPVVSLAFYCSAPASKSRIFSPKLIVISPARRCDGKPLIGVGSDRLDGRSPFDVVILRSSDADDGRPCPNVHFPSHR